MKKILSLLLCLAMLLSLTACGEKDSDSGDRKSGSKKNTEKPAANGETITTNLWSLTYDDEVWIYEEDDLSDNDDYCSLELIIPDDDDSYVTSVEIQISLDDQEEFRENLHYYGFDAYEYAENNAYDLVDVGGVDCLEKEGESWGEKCLTYIGRDEAASITVYIQVRGECGSDDVQTLLAGLSIFAEDIGNEDAPWPWNGEPFSAADSSKMVGTYTISSQFLPMDESLVTFETFDHFVAVSGGKAYILGDETLRQYAFNGKTLTYEKDIAVDGDFENIQRTNDGTIWVSAFMEPLISLKDGVQTASFDGGDNVSMHPSGAWGISWFSSSECEKLTFSGGTMQTSAISFPEVSTISTLIVDEDYIYVCGHAKDESGHKVFIYDTNGTLKLTLADEDGDSLGSITFMAQTPNGFLGMDGNLREVVLWTADGTHIGTAEDSDLFGTSYPWFCGGTVLEDGSILVIMTEDRADESAKELVAFKLTVQ